MSGAGVEHVRVEALDHGLPYSTATIYAGLVFLSGVIPDRTGGAGLNEQVHEVIDLAEHALSRAGATLKTVLRAGCHLTSAADFEEFNDIWRTRLPAPYPARTTTISVLAAPGVRFEMDAVATRVAARP